jgi:GWxTD domain-containing protein
LKNWRDGPVRGFLTMDQFREFGELRTDAARQTFIDRFWADLEDAAGGPKGTYRGTFERRCEAANARFTTGSLDGWQTDRGRVLVALGEPSSVRREPGDASSIEKELWTYGAARDRPETSLTIVFYRCADGAYKLDPGCHVERDWTSVVNDVDRAEYFQKLKLETPSSDSVRLLAMLSEFLPPVPGGIALARPRESETTAASFQERGPAGGAATAPNAHALEDATYFFRAVDGTVLALMTLELVPPRDDVQPGKAQPASYLGAVTLEETGRRGEDLPETSPKTLSLDEVESHGRQDRAAFLGRAHLRAGGTYAMRYAVEDGARDEIFVRNALVGVPDLGAGFSASSVVPAQSFGPAGPDADLFQVGSEEVVPKPGGAFRRGELLRLYLQVYDAKIDAATAKARVDVVFRFYRTGQGIAKRYGKPFSVRGAAGASMGLALPIGDWPTGPYRVEVELWDRVAERRTSAEGQFSIVAD